MKMISVIIPVYNIKNYVATCIESILKQDYKNVEIIIVNDGSTDGSQDVCKSYSEKYNQIKLINKVNGGLSDARNTGIINAEGEYILFLDGDDFLKKDILFELAKFISLKNRPDIVLYNYAKFYQERKAYEVESRSINAQNLSNKSEESILEYLLLSDNKFNWFAWQGIYKRNHLIKNKLFFVKGRLYEDVLWLPNVLVRARSIEYFDKPVYNYRLEREGQITSTVTQKSLTDNIYVPLYWEEKLAKKDLDKELNELLMSNFSIRYYYSIWFSGFLETEEREKVLALLRDNKNLLRYSNNRITNTTRYLVKTIGFKNTSSLFRLAIRLKRKLTIH